MIDWGIGHYEQTAAELEPVAEHVIAAAQVEPGARVLDVACGTGNAALLAAQAGAIAIGIDSAERLIEVARERARADGAASAEFVVGDAQELPFDRASFDIVVSVFGIIFAPDADVAVAEALRVLRPQGRAVITAWVPAGPIDEAIGTIGRAVASVTGVTRNRFAWHDREALRELAARHGAIAESENAELEITAPSLEAFAERQSGHPMQIAARAALEPAGVYDEVDARVKTILRERNEDPDAFRVHSPYRIIRLRHATA